jgi:hypothetical protein
MHGITVLDDNNAGKEYTGLGPGAHAVPVLTLIPDVQQAMQAPMLAPQVAAHVALPQQSQEPPQVGLLDPNLTRHPKEITCPHCQQESRTRIQTFPTWQTWTSAGVFMFVFWPICWVPLVLNACKQTDHFCVLCGTHVGQVNAFEDCFVFIRGQL